MTSGLNLEDINYFKASYQMMLDKPEMSKLLNYTHWVDHSVTEIPDPPTKKKKVITSYTIIITRQKSAAHGWSDHGLYPTLEVTIVVPFLILSAPL